MASSAARRRVRSEPSRPVSALWSGERRPIVALAIALGSPGGFGGEDGTEISDNAIACLATASIRASSTIAAAGGVVVERTLSSIAAVWGHPTAIADAPARAAAATSAIVDATDPVRMSVAIAYGTATILTAAAGLLWSPALIAVQRRAAADLFASATQDLPAADGRATVERAIGLQADLDALPQASADLVRVLSVFGDAGDQSVLGPVLGTSRSALEAAVAHLVKVGVILAIPDRYRTNPRGPTTRYRLASPDFAAHVAATILAADRARLHARALAALDGIRPPSATGSGLPSAPALARIAHHAEEAGLIDRALTTLEAAITAALASDRASDAAPLIASALALIARSDVVIDARRRVDIVRLAATATGALHGNAHPSVRALCQRGIELLEQLPAGSTDMDARFEFLWGLQTHDLVRGEIERASATGLAVIALAERSGRVDLVCVASRLYGLTAFKAGDLVAARAALTHAIDLIDAEGGREGTGLARCAAVSFASDQKAVALAALAWVEAVAGRAHRSADLMRMALARATALRHPHTEAHVTSLLATRAYLIGERSTALSLARTALAVAREHGFDYWLTWASMVAAASDDGLAPAEATIEIASARRRHLETGARQAIPLAAVLLSRVHLAAGAHGAAAAAIAEAMPMVAPGRVALWRSSLLTMQARVETAMGRSTSAKRLATAAYREAGLIGADLFAGHATGALLGIVGVGDDTPYRRVTHKLVA